MKKSNSRIWITIGIIVLCIPPMGILMLALAFVWTNIQYNYGLFNYTGAFAMIAFVAAIPVFILGSIVQSLKRFRLGSKILITILVAGLIFLGIYLPLKSSIKPVILTGATDKIFAPACQGQPVKGVTDYQPGSGPHPIVMLQDNLMSIREVPDRWMPKSLGEVELVACLGKSKKVLIETCHYEGGGRLRDTSIR